jgi:hypothetical protein
LNETTIGLFPPYSRLSLIRFKDTCLKEFEIPLRSGNQIRQTEGGS